MKRGIYAKGVGELGPGWSAAQPWTSVDLPRSGMVGRGLRRAQSSRSGRAAPLAR
jgi:hypothetical protein